MASARCRAEGGATSEASPAATRTDRPATKVPFAPKLQRLFSSRNYWDYTVHPRKYFFERRWALSDVGYALFFTAVHVGALFAPWYFTWPAFAAFVAGYIITGCGITLSYHRQLTHRSFSTPKWLEYLFAYCGVLALQSDPIFWVSLHRHHHRGTDTDQDVHSPMDGFWWSHVGWLLDAGHTKMRNDQSNVTDLASQWFYRFLRDTYGLHAVTLPIAGLYALGGLPFVIWGFCVRAVWVWHITWSVNSVCHIWGFQDWNTTDHSFNNWAIGLLAFGEGWHNNHHAFEGSCRHGLKWWQVDPTWYTIKFLEACGLASDLKYPSEGRMRKLSFPVD